MFLPCLSCLWLGGVLGIDGCGGGGINAKKILNSISEDPNNTCYTEERFKFSSPEYDLSVIIPAYNSEKWVRKALDSIIDQVTRYKFEIIVVDDGSTDGTAHILDEYNFENVKVIHQENRGFSGARNTGLTVNQGKYIMFVDSDDYLLPDAIEKLLFCAMENNADVVCGNYRCEYDTGDIKYICKYSNGEIEPLGNIHGQPWGKVYRREIFNHLKFPEKYWFEDSIFAQIVWPMCKKCLTISDTVYSYYVNRYGISMTAIGQTKSLDSYYITKQLLKDKAKFGLILTQSDYDYFLKMIRLTYNRTFPLGRKVRKCLFVLQCELRTQFFSGFSSDQEKSLELALLTQNYKKFIIAINFTRFI